MNEELHSAGIISASTTTATCQEEGTGSDRLPQWGLIDLTILLTPVLPFGEDDFRLINIIYSHHSDASYQQCDHEQRSVSQYLHL